MSFKPMLAAKIGFDELDKLAFPLFVSPKLDGIRAIQKDGRLMSRALKDFPNLFTMARFSSPKLTCMDGELIMGSPTAEDVFNKTTRAVMTINGEPDVKYYVFDNFRDVKHPFSQRFDTIKVFAKNHPNVEIVEQQVVHSIEELEEAEQYFVGLGYEGIMLRSPNSLYKFGRSTLKEGWLVKLKRFEDSEAIILDVVQLRRNTNEAETDNLGHQVRSSKKSGMVPMPLVGAITVKDVKTGVQFEIGSGFTEAQRSELWKARQSIIGHVVKYRFQPTGVKDKPRFPTFIGFRLKIDL